MGALCFLRFVGLIRAKQSLWPYLDNHPALDLKYFSGGIQIITQMGLILFTVLHEKYRHVIYVMVITERVHITSWAEQSHTRNFL